MGSSWDCWGVVSAAMSAAVVVGFVVLSGAGVGAVVMVCAGSGSSAGSVCDKVCGSTASVDAGSGVVTGSGVVLGSGVCSGAGVLVTAWAGSGSAGCSAWAVPQAVKDKSKATAKV